MMTRRSLMALVLAAGTALPLSAAEPEMIDYRPGLVTERLVAGETVFLDFSAVWCTTCKAQERVIDALQQENPAYVEAVTFVRVDWDEYRGADITRRLNIPRRSTLVVLKGEEELGRIVAGTSRRQIQGLMDAALTAAQAGS